MLVFFINDTLLKINQNDIVRHYFKNIKNVKVIQESIDYDNYFPLDLSINNVSLQKFH
jgi:hypothetical protein